MAALMIVDRRVLHSRPNLGFNRNSEANRDALETMGVNPLGYFIGPRLVAASWCFDAHGFLDIIGIFGAMSRPSGWSPGTGIYWQSGSVRPDAERSTAASNRSRFGFTVIAICAFEGFNTHRRSREPGAARERVDDPCRGLLEASAVLALDYLITSFQ